LKNPNICGRPVCEENDNKFKYNVYSTYRYDYKMFVKTEFVGSGQNSSEMHVVAGIEVGFPSLCGGILKINTVELRERALPVVDYYDEDREEVEEIELHPRNDELGEELRKHVLRFSFHDGIIDEVCPEEEEVTWALNLKKGILSTLQNTMQRFDVDYNTTETDVSGTCDVSYMLMGTTDTSLLIQKHKDITSCTSRYKTNSILQTTPYNFRQNYAAWPVLKSDSFCNVRLTGTLT
jgi:Lipoprotein amino terminal region